MVQISMLDDLQVRVVDQVRPLSPYRASHSTVRCTSTAHRITSHSSIRYRSTAQSQTWCRSVCSTPSQPESSTRSGRSILHTLSPYLTSHRTVPCSRIPPPTQP
eukprot:786292-Rhodomonas_salina.1